MPSTATMSLFDMPDVTPPSGDAADPWFDQIGVSMAEFGADGRWIRHNAAFNRWLETSVAPGTRLNELPLPLQALLGWPQSDALSLMLNTESPLRTSAVLPWLTGDMASTVFTAQVYAADVPSATMPGLQRRYLCVLDPVSTPATIAKKPSASALDTQALLRELTTILDNSPAGIAHFVNGEVVRCNRRFERMLGFPLGEGTQKQHMDRLMANSARIRTVVSEAAQVLRSQSQYDSEFEVTTPGSSPSWYALSITRIGPPEQPLDAMVVLSNISRIRQQQAKLETLGRDLSQQADRTRAILDSVFVGIVTLDSQGISWMNRSARRMFGGDLHDFIGKPLSVVAPPELDHPFRMLDYLDALEDGQSHAFECQVAGRDGRDFWVVGNAVVTLDEHHHRQTTYALLDIDRRREAESRIEQAESKLKRIIELAPMAMSVHEAPSLRVVQANQGALTFMRRDSQMSWGESLEDVLPADQARLMRAEMMATLDSQTALHREHRIEVAPGVEQVWELNYLPISGDGQSSEQVLLVASDVTEQRAAEKARLDAAIAQRDLLVKEVHHRIKNNLQGVAGLLQQIASRKPDLAMAISEVVGQVQAIAQVYGLQVGTAPELRLDNVVRAITTSVQRLFAHQIELTLQGPMVTEWLLPEAESIPIALCLNELLTNAHKHGQPDTPIVCMLVSHDRGVNVRITNTGQLPAGFNFDQVRGGVTGLGLVRALAPRRSSTITLRQEGPQVITELQLRPPGIRLITPPPVLAEPTVQQYALWPQ